MAYVPGAGPEQAQQAASIAATRRAVGQGASYSTLKRDARMRTITWDLVNPQLPPGAPGPEDLVVSSEQQAHLPGPIATPGGLVSPDLVGPLT